ncbi:hypothetical protein GCM10009080_07330 [Cupriavidus pauculus]
MRVSVVRNRPERRRAPCPREERRGNCVLGTMVRDVVGDGLIYTFTIPGPGPVVPVSGLTKTAYNVRLTPKGKALASASVTRYHCGRF